ncbi:MAG: DNA internalization-related competence protein ComEC/Rec2 [Candidatus Cloacimonetes bacterium]|nr:DNA internalization-related competence protein ComEC/Rec2 [Candidatus Cloacimonadota bacterium]
MKKTQALIVPALLWGFGIILAKLTSIPLIIVILVISFCFLLSFFKLTRLLGLSLIVVFLAVFRYEIPSMYPLNHIKSVLEKQANIKQPIIGMIVSEVRPKDEGYSFLLELRQVKDKEIRGRIKFFSFTKELEYGDVISTVATINHINGPTNPGSIDYQRIFELKKIYGSGWSLTPVKIIGQEGSIFQKIVNDIRQLLRKRIEERFGEYSGFIKAIIIAERDDIEDRRNIMNRAGLSHLLAVSGLHVGLITLILSLVLNAVIHKRNINRIIIMIFLIAYAGICLWAPSVTRAALMINLYLLAKIIQQKPDANNILFSSLLIILIVNPDQLFSVGLQMSYLAVFVLLNILPKVKFIKLKKKDLKLMSIWKKLVNGCLLLVFTSFILNLFFAPLTAFHFHQFGFNGIAGNLLGIPLLTLILSLSLIILSVPNLLLVVFQASFKVVMIIFDTWSQLIAALPLHFDCIFLNIPMFILSYCSIISIYYIFKSNRKMRKVFIIATAIFISTFFFLGRKGTDKLIITFFDCGLGDMALIQTPENNSILIDTGPPEKELGTFKSSALPYFQQNAISSIDYVVLTHAHNDHYGGMFTLLQNINVERLVVTDEFQNRNIWSRLSQRTEKCSLLTISDTLSLKIDQIKLKIIHPDLKFQDSNINNLSIVSRLDYKDISVLFSGDLELEGEVHLLSYYDKFLNCDILKVGHHGSKTASSTDFIRAVDPQYAVISTSKKNRFNFPHKITLKNFKFLGNNLMITGYDGACQIFSDGNSIQINTFLSQKCLVDNGI